MHNVSREQNLRRYSNSVNKKIGDIFDLPVFLFSSQSILRAGLSPQPWNHTHTHIYTHTHTNSHSHTNTATHAITRTHTHTSLALSVSSSVKEFLSSPLLPCPPLSFFHS